MKNREKLYKLTVEIQKEIVEEKLFTDVSRCHPQMFAPFDWLHWQFLPTLNDRVMLKLLAESFRFLESPDLNYALSREKRFGNLRNLLQNWDKTFASGNKERQPSSSVSLKRVSQSEEELLKDFFNRSIEEYEISAFRTLLEVAKENNFAIAISKITKALTELAQKRYDLNFSLHSKVQNVGQWLKLEEIGEALRVVDPQNEQALIWLNEVKKNNKYTSP